MSTAERFLRLYPRAWRERYGEEFLATVGYERLHPQQIVDIVSGAVDAWFSADVRGVTRVQGVSPNTGRPKMLRSMLACERRTTSRYTKRDALVGSGVMVGATLIFTMLGVVARNNGWPVTGEVLTSVGFMAALLLSLPFWLMKGQPRKAQVVIIGGTLVFMVGIGYLATII